MSTGPDPKAAREVMAEARLGLREGSPEAAMMEAALFDLAGTGEVYLHNLLVLAASAYGLALGKAALEARLATMLEGLVVIPDDGAGVA